MLEKAEEDCSDIAICGYSYFDDKTGKDYWEDKIRNRYLIASPISPKDYSKDLFTICSASACTKLFKNSFLRKNLAESKRRYIFAERKILILWNTKDLESTLKRKQKK
jgi:hypothetical protein